MSRATLPKLIESSTVASPFVEKLLEGAKAKGYNVNQILRENGISPNVLLVRGSRVTFEQLAALTLALVRLLDDEFLGLTDRPVRRNTFRLSCYSVINAETLGEAMKIMTDFANIAEGALIHELQHHGQQVSYTLRRRPRRHIRNSYAMEYCMLSIHRTLNWMGNRRLPLQRVNADYAVPAYHDEYRHMFYGAPVFFDQPHSALVFPASVLGVHNVRDMKQLKDFVKQAPLTLLSQTIKPDDLPGQLRVWVERQLSRHQHAPDINAASRALGLHPQALRRQLIKHGTNYKTIKTEVRRDLAINLIGDAARTVESISALLDFSEPSAFIRAFKGWTGLTPLAYRKLSA